MTLWSEINADKLILRLFLCPTSMMFPLRLAIFLESRAPWDHDDACLSKREILHHREMVEQLEGILKCPMAKFDVKHGHLFLLYHIHVVYHIQLNMQHEDKQWTVLYTKTAQNPQQSSKFVPFTVSFNVYAELQIDCSMWTWFTIMCSPCR